MHIILNGEDYQLDKGSNVGALLQSLELDQEKIAVERNLEIVPANTFDEVELFEGDRLEIIHFIGGG